jgi:CubicO group peptidase (beta-lactamase class C family)
MKQHWIFIIIVLTLSFCASGSVTAQTDSTTREAAINDHIMALEQSTNQAMDELVIDFDNEHFSDQFKTSHSPDSRALLMSEVKQAATNVGGVLAEEDGDAVVVTLEGERMVEVRFTVEDQSPWKIDSLSVTDKTDAPPAYSITADNVAATLAELEEEGFSGVAHVRINNEIILNEAYGFADSETQRPNKVETIFGTGSRPIDYTIAGIYLLEQRGLIDLDDSIVKYFDDVPVDKREMTLRHLLTGASGLQDFPGLPEDWDQDLGWIDRSTFERRALAQTLLFAPGTGEQHSHTAFGLLAAVIERVTGETYYGFLRKNFFDPAGMTRTGEYGESRDLGITDFAAGGGPSVIGLPNIPPNWGPTSWLVKGSGGMYASVPDLIRFYRYLRSGDVLEPQYTALFNGMRINVDGSERGFELFSISNNGGTDEVFLVTNMGSGHRMFRELTRSLARMIRNAD